MKKKSLEQFDIPFSIPLFKTEEQLNGALNTNTILTDKDGSKYVWRVPNNTEHPPIIKEELTFAGLHKIGCSYSFRTLKQQSQFIKKAKKYNIKVLTPLFETNDGMLFQYINAQTLNQNLQKGKTTHIDKMLDNIRVAHQNGLVIGDRWVKNTFVLPDDIIEFDFDIQLEGSHAHEFETAQILVYLLYFSKQPKKIISYLKSYFKNKPLNSQPYDKQIVLFIMINYAFFIQSKVELPQRKLALEALEVEEILWAK